MAKGAAAGRAVIGIVAITAVVAVGFVATAVGGITCNEDVQSPEQAPRLCGSLGSGMALALPPLVGGVAVLVLLLSGIRARTFVVVSTAIAAAELALVLMWALVSHGTIHY